MDEFDLIHKYFKPLAGDGAFGLTDDIASLPKSVVSKDLLVAGVHFFADDPLDLVAQKVLRVNISDLVAKGCAPIGYLLGIVWPKNAREQDVAQFCRGLERDQSQYNVRLLGGDTTRHQIANGPLTISISMIGTPLGAGPILRSGAQPGDDIWVTGTIGDSGLGLQSLLGNRPVDDAVDAYRLPTPPFVVAGDIAKFATASLDVSDGLAADLGHLANASNVSVQIDMASLPLSNMAQSWISERGEEGYTFLATCGDDYQTVFTASPTARPLIEKAAAEKNIRVTKIGECAVGVDGAGFVRFVDADGDEVQLGSSGFSHF